MQNLLKYIVENLVDNKDAVTVEEKIDGDATLLIIKVDESDIGKVIGKNGKIVSAIRTLVRGFNGKNGFEYKKYAVKVNAH